MTKVGEVFFDITARTDGLDTAFDRARRDADATGRSVSGALGPDVADFLRQCARLLNEKASEIESADAIDDESHCAPAGSVQPAHYSQEQSS
ncbi:hypothetical protein [Gloeobacter violaceus]|uniref:Gsr3890 protein n=1 Tax=Gloeobacter violaceus (strain ATCC 29082 / PCC 7421) TaxID=251221 RepID=Q7NEI9_GLOVI|nr:hypothetical protein [Gloeobacter violaceus]BAC91831.1 gsr3890 [Gloeobacter violaceus PCC 7421]